MTREEEVIKVLNVESQKQLNERQRSLHCVKI